MAKVNAPQFDNKTIAKLAVAIATANSLAFDKEPLDATLDKVLETLDAIDGMERYSSYHPGA